MANRNDYSEISSERKYNLLAFFPKKKPNNEIQIDKAN